MITGWLRKQKERNRTKRRTHGAAGNEEKMNRTAKKMKKKEIEERGRS
jgi:hypothetical protein